MGVFLLGSVGEDLEHPRVKHWDAAAGEGHGIPRDPAKGRTLLGRARGVNMATTQAANLGAATLVEDLGSPRRNP